MTAAREIKIKLAHLTLAALSYGNENDPVILAFHGWLDNAATFSQLAPLLHGYHVICIDMPGHGHSDHLPEGMRYHFLDGVDIVLQILQALNLERCILMGHSLGGAIASVVASSFPDKVEKLISIDAIGPLSEESIKAPGRLREAVKMFIAAEKMDRKQYKSLEQMIMMRSRINSIEAELITPLVKRASKEVAEKYQWRFDPSLSLPSLSYFTEDQVLAYLAAIKVPTLLIEADAGVLSDHEILDKRKAAIENLLIEPVSGPHHIHLAEAKIVAEAILKFLDS